MAEFLGERSTHLLLSNAEMGHADRRAVELGVPSLTLMENAGRAVADASWAKVKRGDKLLVLCGPGNNGGDGFVAARHLKERGCDVVVVLLGDQTGLRGDAGVMAELWDGPVLPADADWPQDVALIIDALFGAGLTRPLEGLAALLVRQTNELAARGVPIVAVDVPSGLDGTTGRASGPVIKATSTVTFFRRKPGHVLLPGRLLCGEVVVADIGIPDRALGDGLTIKVAANHPDVFVSLLPLPQLDAHKYARGHAVVVSGPAFQSGAARLAARGALRAGSGLVTVAAPASALAENAAHLTAIMLRPCGGARALGEMLQDKRKNAVAIGPGAGVGADTAELVLAALASGAGTVLDADALTSFKASEAGAAEAVSFGFTAKYVEAGHGPLALFAAIKADPSRPVVLTPHEGEFARLFGSEFGDRASKIDRARAAAQSSGAVVVLKGADTVVGAPDGRAVVNENAPPWLATAGSGDVLTGFVTGLLAQGMPAFEAASAAAWMHGECAELFGPGLIAEDLPELLPQVLRRLHQA